MKISLKALNFSAGTITRVGELRMGSVAEQNSLSVLFVHILVSVVKSKQVTNETNNSLKSRVVERVLETVNPTMLKLINKIKAKSAEKIILDLYLALFFMAAINLKDNPTYSKMLADNCI